MPGIPCPPTSTTFFPIHLLIVSADPLTSQLQVTVFNLPGYGEAGRAFAITLSGRVQPFMTSWRISSVKVEIHLVSFTPEKWKTYETEAKTATEQADQSLVADTSGTKSAEAWM